MADALAPRAPATKGPDFIRAEGAIRTAIRNWSGGHEADAEGLPVLREGKVYRHSVAFTDPVKSVLSASVTPSDPEKKKREERLERIAAAALSVVDAIVELPPEERSYIRCSEIPPSIEGRVVNALGSDIALVQAAYQTAIAARQSIALQRKVWGGAKRKRGAPRHEAAYAVARELAKIYAKITGRPPTYSEDENGLSGEFTPVLRDVFDALGWQGRQLRGPATAAIKSVTEADLAFTAPMPFGGLFSAVSRPLGG